MPWWNLHHFNYNRWMEPEFLTSHFFYADFPEEIISRQWDTNVLYEVNRSCGRPVVSTKLKGRCRQKPYVLCASSIAHTPLNKSNFTFFPVTLSMSIFHPWVCYGISQVPSMKFPLHRDVRPPFDHGSVRPCYGIKLGGTAAIVITTNLKQEVTTEQNFIQFQLLQFQNNGWPGWFQLLTISKLGLATSADPCTMADLPIKWHRHDAPAAESTKLKCAIAGPLCNQRHQLNYQAFTKKHRPVGKLG